MSIAVLNHEGRGCHRHVERGTRTTRCRRRGRTFLNFRSNTLILGCGTAWPKTRDLCPCRVCDRR
jgi:hypothetical protein